jgi:hypothetical protein
MLSGMAWEPGTRCTGISLAAGAVHTVVMSHDDRLRDLETDLVRERKRLHLVRRQVASPGLTLNFLERLGLHWSNATEQRPGGGGVAC